MLLTGRKLEVLGDNTIPMSLYPATDVELDSDLQGKRPATNRMSYRASIGLHSKSTCYIFRTFYCLLSLDSNS